MFQKDTKTIFPSFSMFQFYFHCCNETPDNNQLREEGFIRLTIYYPSLQGSQGNLRELVHIHITSTVKSMHYHLQLPLSFLCSPRPKPRQWRHSGLNGSTSINPIENSLPTDAPTGQPDLENFSLRLSPESRLGQVDK